MGTLTLLIGIPGSGKSTLAQTLVSPNTILVSSDNIREELCGDPRIQKATNKVFKLFFDRAEKELKEGNSVILDATNISAQRRKEIVTRYRKQADNLIAINLKTPTPICIERNSARERIVPNVAIFKMAKNIEWATEEEGWDKVLDVFP